VTQRSRTLLAFATLGALHCSDLRRGAYLGRDGLEYVSVPAGDAILGCSTGCFGPSRFEVPEHIVQISGFRICRTPVTVEAYRRFALSNHIALPPPPLQNTSWSNPDQPIVRVSVSEARSYCSWVGGRLPTGDEWEWSARGGLVGYSYPWGNLSTEALGNFLSTGPSPVFRFAPNGYGLYDMLGNVLVYTVDGRGQAFLRGASWCSGLRPLSSSGPPVGEDFQGGANIGLRCIIPAGAPPNPSLQRTRSARR